MGYEFFANGAFLKRSWQLFEKFIAEKKIIARMQHEFLKSAWFSH